MKSRSKFVLKKKKDITMKWTSKYLWVWKEIMTNYTLKKFETQQRLGWTKDQHVWNQKDCDELKLKISLRPKKTLWWSKDQNFLETQKR
jgi:hypothetical protein